MYWYLDESVLRSQLLNFQVCQKKKLSNVKRIISFLKTGSWSKEVALRVDKYILEQVEALEDKVQAASMQVPVSHLLIQFCSTGFFYRDRLFISLKVNDIYTSTVFYYVFYVTERLTRKFTLFLIGTGSLACLSLFPVADLD